MLKLKPTTLIALDPHTAAFCEAIRRRLETSRGARGRLVQSSALVRDGETLRLETDVASVAVPSFDLQEMRAGSKQFEEEAARALFESERIPKLEPLLIKMLQAGRSFEEIKEARDAGIEVVRQRKIYLLLSASDSFAGSIVLDLAGLIRHLFNTLLTKEVFSLDAVILLPHLFSNPTQPDFANTYGLLKKLDYSAVVGLQQNRPSFDAHWLLDDSNASGIGLGSLAENLTSYVDAFVGFLTADPEESGALIGTRTSRGKSPIYNAFGHGELYFPAEIAITRLGSALARDIITREFLADDAARPDNVRKMLISAKQFVLSKSYTDALTGLEREKGKEALIWHDFYRREEVRSELAVAEYVSKLQREHEKFDRESLLAFNNALVGSSEYVRDEIVALLNVELKRRADATKDGLHEALEFLDTLTDSAIALKADTPSERPQNLITEQREASGRLDQRLGISVDKLRTTSLLDQIYELRNRLGMLRTTLRLMPTPVERKPQQPSRATGPVAEPETESTTESAQAEEPEVEQAEAAPQDEKQNLLDEIEDAEDQLQSLYAQYPQAVIDEDGEAYRMRREATKKAQDQRAEAVAAAEGVVNTVVTQLGAARLTLEDLQQERRQFLYRNFVLHPVLAALLVFGVPALAALGDLGPARQLVEFFWENLWDVLLWLGIVLVIYASIILFIYARGINRRVRMAREQVEILERTLDSALVQLGKAHNEELHLKYQLSAQNEREKMIAHVIEIVRETSAKLRRTLEALAESRDIFDRQHAEAVPPISTMRQPVLLDTDIDAYYQKSVTNVGRVAAIFASEENVRRSEVYEKPIEQFREALSVYASSHFDRLKSLSIEDVLLHEKELISPDTVPHRLKALSDASEPLVPLSEEDEDSDLFAQRDVTLWAGAAEHAALLELYRKNCSEASLRTSEDEQTLRAFTRCLNFPAYFLGKIKFYRACYEREPLKEAATLPDLLPVGRDLSPGVQRAHEQLLLGIAIGLVSRNKAGDYFLADGKQERLGRDRREIAEKFIADFKATQVYAELSAHIQERLSDRNVIHNKLTEFLNREDGLSSSEKEMLDGLVRKYHPLR